MIIVWRVRAKIIRTVLCCVAYDSCTEDTLTRMWAVLKDECWFRFTFSFRALVYHIISYRIGTVSAGSCLYANIYVRTIINDTVTLRLLPVPKNGALKSYTTFRLCVFPVQLIDYFVLLLFAFVVLSSVSSVLYAKRLAGKNDSEMTHFVSSGT